MSYSAPAVSSSGLSIPSYTDILNLLITNYQNIYGAAVYLGPDSSDYQWISVVALALSDAMNLGQLSFNNRSPAFAIGAALDSLVKINGIRRKTPTSSTCQVTITGVAGTVITNGICLDVNGIKWDLPASVTIPGGGSITVTATCETLGAVNALIGQINQIATPVNGWNSVNNATAAVLGQPVETDGQLRGRQSVSVSLPAETILAGTIAGIWAVPGVTRQNTLENPTNATDSFGNPAHSVSACVEGGTNLAVATAIFDYRGIGPLTNPTSSAGAVTVNITDPNTGIITPIGFCRPTYTQIYVIVNAHLLAGGTSATLTAIQTAITNYLNSLEIGETVGYSALVAAAMSVNPNLSLPIVFVESLFLGTAPSPSATADIPMTNFYNCAQPNTITVNSV